MARPQPVGATALRWIPLFENSNTVRLVIKNGELFDGDHVIESMPLHFGNPAYRDVLDVPLILVGADGLAIPDFIRSEDLHYMLLSLVQAPRSETAPPSSRAAPS